MARPRGFDVDAVLEAAKQVFWERGYQGTGIDDLERSTGLNRSSLYWAFADKTTLFLKALDVYLEGFIDPRLAPMESAGANLDDIERFFEGLGAYLRADEDAARRGCLMVNAIAELEGREDRLEGRAQAFRDRLVNAFENALRHGPSAADAGQRARLLASATLGMWLAARIDPHDAALACDAWIGQIRSWRAVAS